MRCRVQRIQAQQMAKQSILGFKGSPNALLSSKPSHRARRQRALPDAVRRCNDRRVSSELPQRTVQRTERVQRPASPRRLALQPVSRHPSCRRQWKCFVRHPERNRLGARLDQRAKPFLLWMWKPRRHQRAVGQIGSHIAAATADDRGLPCS